MDESALKQLICKKFLNGDTDFPIEAGTNLLEEGICDSLGLVRLAQALEKQVAGLRVQNQEITRENFGSMSAILRFIKTKSQG